MGTLEDDATADLARGELARRVTDMVAWARSRIAHCNTQIAAAAPQIAIVPETERMALVAVLGQLGFKP